VAVVEDLIAVFQVELAVQAVAVLAVLLVLTELLLLQTQVEVVVEAVDLQVTGLLEVQA
jgi:hypothetical protein